MIFETKLIIALVFWSFLLSVWYSNSHSNSRLKEPLRWGSAACFLSATLIWVLS